jgi:hypothetical protein
MDHASFAQTSFRASFLPDLMSLMNGDVFIDMRIWRLVGKTKTLRWGEPDCKAPEREVGGGRGFLFDDDGRDLYVAMKAMPGRTGSSSGHQLHRDYRPDTSARDILMQWTREGFLYYKAIMDGKLTNENCDLSSIEG